MEKVKMNLLTIICILFVSCSGLTQDDKYEVLKEKYERMDREAEYVTVDGVPVAQKTRFIREEDNLPFNFDNLKQIALIRHGEPNLVKTGEFSYDEAKQYVKNYDTVGIILPDEPFFMIEEDEEVLLYSSTIRRARHTAEYLFGSDSNIVEDKNFREFERSLGSGQYKMRLPLKYWTTSARILWMLGIDREGVESFKEARRRAKEGAAKLNALSEEHDKIVLVAHGFLNRYIKKYLEKEGWEVVRDGGSNYFGTTVLAKIEEDGQLGKPSPSITQNNN